ncbi:hypothetical protein BH23VER1_BH23VER1_04860 [soil metagenome]
MSTMSPRQAGIILSAVTGLAIVAALVFALRDAGRPEDRLPPAAPESVGSPRPTSPDALEASVRDPASEYQRFIAAAALDTLVDPRTVGDLLGRFGSATRPSDVFARDILASRLVALDFSRAVARALSDDSLRGALATDIKLALGFLGAADGKLVDAVMAAEAPGVDEVVRRLQQIGDGEAEAVLQTLGEGDFKRLRDLRWERLRTLIYEDPGRAIAAAHAIEDENERIYLGGPMLVRYADSDPPAAFEASVALGSADNHRLAGSQAGIMAKWIESDLAAAKAKLFAPDFPLQMRHLQPIMRVLAAHDHEAAIEWATQHVKDSKIRVDALVDLTTELGKHAPERGKTAVLNELSVREDMVPFYASRFAEEWSKHDAPAALEWALAQEGEIRLRAVENIASHLGQADSETAFAILESGALPPEDQVRLIKSSTLLARKDLARFLMVADTLPGEQSLAVLGSTARNLLHTGRTEEARMIVEEMGPGSPGNERNTQLCVAQFAKTDPQGAAAWVTTFTDSETRAYGVRNVIDIWGRLDLEAAATYASSFPDGSPERDHAAAAMAERTLAHDPEGALAWIDAVSDERLREQFLRTRHTALLTLAPDRLEILAARGGISLRAEIEAEKARRAYLIESPL